MQSRSDRVWNMLNKYSPPPPHPVSLLHCYNESKDIQCLRKGHMLQGILRLRKIEDTVERKKEHSAGEHPQMSWTWKRV